MVVNRMPPLSPEAVPRAFRRNAHSRQPRNRSRIRLAFYSAFLACFGSFVGRGAWVPVLTDIHHPAFFIGIVGATSSPAKAWGSAWRNGRSLKPTANGRSLPSALASALDKAL